MNFVRQAKESKTEVWKHKLKLHVRAGIQDSYTKVINPNYPAFIQRLNVDRESQEAKKRETYELELTKLKQKLSPQDSTQLDKTTNKTQSKGTVASQVEVELTDMSRANNNNESVSSLPDPKFATGSTAASVSNLPPLPSVPPTGRTYIPFFKLAFHFFLSLFLFITQIIDFT